MESIEDQMLYVSFNQDYSAFVVGTERGFRIYNSYPYKDYYERIFDGGIGIVEMLNKSNVIALVGGGKFPKYSRNKIILWDDYQAKVMAELSFTSYIKNNIDTIDTFENLKGIIAITYDPLINLLAYPDKASGYVKLKNYDKNITVLTNAHNTKIACLSFSHDGLFLATASEKGTFIRTFRSEDGSFLEEYPIGGTCQIYSISFDQHVQFLSSTCSTGVVNIFSLTSSYRKLRELMNNEWDYLNPFSSEAPWAIFRIPDSKSISAFCEDDKVIIISSEGRYYVAKFKTQDPGDCIKIEEINLKISSYN